MSNASLQQLKPNSSPPPLDSTNPGGRCNGLWSLPRRPPLRVTTEFDRDNDAFFHKISCKFSDSLAKLKLTFEEQNALLKSALNLAPGLQLRGEHDIKILNVMSALSHAAEYEYIPFDKVSIAEGYND